MSDGASDVYGSLLEEMLHAQDARKASIEQRGVAVVTTSGALVTLLFGLVSILAKDKSFAFPSSAKLPIAIALPLFVLAVVFGLASNVPLSYEDFDPADLSAKLPGLWNTSKAEAMGKVADTRLAILLTNGRLNQLKARVLICALIAEVAAVASVAIAVLLVLQI